MPERPAPRESEGAMKFILYMLLVTASGEVRETGPEPPVFYGLDACVTEFREDPKYQRALPDLMRRDAAIPLSPSAVILGQD